MKLKLRILDDTEVRDFRERAEARSAVYERKTSWQFGEYSLHQEFSRIGPGGQPVFQLRAQGPRAAALNRELAGLEFFSGHGWYHLASQTVVLERFAGQSLPAICLLDLSTLEISDAVARQRLIWRSSITGALLVHDDSDFAVLDARGDLRVVLGNHRFGFVIEDMLIAFNEHQPRTEMSLVDPVLMQRLDYLSPEAIGAELGVEFGRDLSIRLLYRNELDLCFELLFWNGSRSTAIRRFSVCVTSIALGTIDD